MKTLVCLLEEPSAKNMLNTVLPKLLPADIEYKLFAFQGKSDLEKNIIGKIRYWKLQDTYFLILRDQDSGDCRQIKRHLQELIDQTGKSDRCLIRIACHELESFFLGDLHAVEQGLQISGLAACQRKAKFRRPDSLTNAAEELFRLTKKQYQKMEGSRLISPYLRLDGSNQSVSFRFLLSGIRKLLSLP